MPYHSYEDMKSHFHDLEYQYPNLCRYMSIGTTVQGREIPCLMVGKGNNNVLMEGASHGDEWSAQEMIYMWVDYLIDNQGDSIVDRILQNTKQYCIPMMSPDAHEMKQRKNANGVDCNRNFASDWCGCGSSTDPYSPIYKGPYAFSEPETLSYQLMLNVIPFKRGISVHSGVEVLMYPWGYTYDPSPDKEHFQSVCNQINTEIQNRGYHPYTSGQISTGLPEKLTYPDIETLEKDLKILEENRETTYVYRTGKKELILYCASGTSVDYYYMSPRNILSWVLEVSYTKTPPYNEIQDYFQRQLPLQIIVSLDAIPTEIDDSKDFVVKVSRFT